MISDRSLDSFVGGIPKAEIHVHIEGTLEPEMLLQMARRHGLPAPYPSAEACRAAYRFMICSTSSASTTRQ